MTNNYPKSMSQEPNRNSIPSREHQLNQQTQLSMSIFLLEIDKLIIFYKHVLISGYKDLIYLPYYIRPKLCLLQLIVRNYLSRVSNPKQ